MNMSLWASVGLSISLAATPAVAGPTPPRPRATIADIIERSGGQFDQNGNDFDVLLTALGAAGLTSALDDASDNLTLFAPTDAAFVATAQDLGFTGTNEGDAWEFLVSALTTLGGGDPIPTLTNVLLYHVSPQRLSSLSILRLERRNETIPTLLTGDVITPQRGRLIDNDPDFENPFRIAPRDVRASNGLIQRINRVLLPIDIAPTEPPADTIAGIVAASGGTFDTNNSDFDILLTAVQTAGLVDELQDPNVLLTVFAPTDAAFIATARDLGFTGTDENGAWLFLVNAFTTLGGGSPIEPLTNVLLYHILPFQADSFFLDILDQANLAVRPLFRDAPLWFNGLEIIDFADGTTNPRRLSREPVNASNGNIYPIDRVLLPFDIAPTQPPATTIAGIVAASGGTFDTNNSDFDILLTAVQTAGLVDELQDPNVLLTVFAPTDGAFIATARDLGFTGTDENGAWLFLVNAFTTLGGGDPIQPLTNVLLYHILPFQADSFFLDILDDANLAVRPLFRDAPLWFNGLEIIDVADGFTNPRRTREPVRASNGNIYPIDRVLLPFDL